MEEQAVMPATDATAEATQKEQNSYGRFKSAEELLAAYTALEREFTKRSQRLKALEKERAEPAPAVPVYAEQNWQQRVEDFGRAYPAAEPFKAALAEEILKGGLGDNPNCLELALLKVLLTGYKSPSDLADSEEFLEAYVYGNPKVAERVLTDYLTSLNRAGSPKIISGGGSAPLTPPTRPKSFIEAGRLASNLLK